MIFLECANVTYCFVTHSLAIITVVMVIVQQITQCVLWFVKFKSVVSEKHQFQQIYRQDPPIIPWYNHFKETRNVDIKKFLGRSHTG